MTEAAYSEDRFISHADEDRPAPSPTSGEIVRLIPVKHCDVLHGVDYLRTCCDLIRITAPGHLSDHRRACMVASATGIALGTVERILAYKREGLKSVKTETLVTLFRLATANGKDVFAVDGVREVHDAIFGGFR